MINFILCLAGILRSDMRIKFETQPEESLDSNRLTVGYRVRLRGDSRLFAEAVVDSLKVSFSVLLQIYSNAVL